MIISWIEAFSASALKLGNIIETPKYRAFELCLALFGVVLLVSLFLFFSNGVYVFYEMTSINKLICILAIIAIAPLLLRLLIGELFAMVLAFIFAVLILPAYILYVVYAKLIKGKSKL